MSNPVIDVIVSGHLCVDLLPAMSHVPVDELGTPGRLFEIGPLAVSTGGAVSNTGLALHRLGARVRLMASVGDDLLGEVIISSIRQRDPQLCEFIRVLPGQSSSYTVVLAPEKVDRIFLHFNGQNATFNADYIDFAQLEQARLFHMGYPTIMPRLIADNGAGLEALYRRARTTGAVTSLDMAMPDPDGSSGRVDWAQILKRTLPHVDVFLPSIDEILFMMRRADYDAWHHDLYAHLTADYLRALADDLLALGPAITGFKLGPYGAYLHTADEARLARLERLPIKPGEWAHAQDYVPAFEVSLAGTTGAGDAAYAGLLYALLRGMAPRDAITWACAVGGCNVETTDATSGIRTAKETQARLDAGWPNSAKRIRGF